jgi:hypothetical protein
VVSSIDYFTIIKKFRADQVLKLPLNSSLQSLQTSRRRAFGQNIDFLLVLIRLLYFQHNVAITKHLARSTGKKNAGNEPIYAALGKDLDESIPTVSDRSLTRNRALLHYIATLAVSNTETDEFNYEFVQSLLDGGANINEAVDTYGQTIFHEVARSWNLDVAAFLLKHGG